VFAAAVRAAHFDQRHKPLRFACLFDISLRMCIDPPHGRDLPITPSAERVLISFIVGRVVRMLDFEAWLESSGRSSAEMALKARLLELLSK
jgi:hypothetical protein